ncbi:MAG: hypothetical protein V1726_01245 [Methanobacteriota archaeon]
MKWLYHKRRIVWHNTEGISLMYDAVVFIVMVSLSGAILLPVLQGNIANQSSIETHREHVADETLNTYLVSRVDSFSYKVGGDIIDDIAGHLGIDNSSDGLYGSILNWLLAREQLHKTHAELIAEDLGCQFRLPLSLFGTNRFNIFTGDYDRQLKNETRRFFIDHLGEKYQYNLTALWHPIRGVPFGGELMLGDTPPATDSFVAHSCIMMPYSPVITINGTKIVFSKHWVKTELFYDVNLFGRSVIPELANISIILENYSANISSPFHDRGNATNATRENVSAFVYGFLIDGVWNETHCQVFPGVVNITLTYGFEKLEKTITEYLGGALNGDAVNNFTGDALGSVDAVFSGLNTSITNPLIQGFLEAVNESLVDMLGFPVGSISDALDYLKTMIKENVTVLVKSFLDPYLTFFVETVFNYLDEGLEFVDLLCDWLFDRLSISKADITLTIWEARG